ncbi:uncharacterized protein LOC121793018 [Salvia splendens]|uniref:uncharacterized protein LOC121793018 n=1 Tax=Salvia splendens TaxID=180675 RepID=UPI001C26D33F|nr:uncharacterized protein LOC121793018 [Salvia splendens]XP_042047135.1 uncharacterized protein LOC121793018 [Salvia splendens]XP_042047136.1 uncharacterized protein LOC121793018 [Salvia splendens]XP_042047137.1 uncharacterized protein LOC121793018 [Salvia splendens]XP_042047138.1 uncharacterized protein LOC121793018 [Salvia splendens]
MSSVHMLPFKYLLEDLRRNVHCCEQWLAFRNDGKYTAAGYAQVASEKMTKYSDVGGQTFWNPFEKSETIKRRRYFITKLLQGAIRGLAYMHDHERLHQSLGPASVALNTIAEKDAVYLVPMLRDLAFSVDIRYCLTDDRLVEAVKFLDLGDGAGWELLQAMLNRDYRQRPIAEAVLNHRFLAGAFL